ncbi:hypothetical protein CX1_13 [Klebsiella phage CX1]|uniref:Uncharacterized protein n=1 Tax=Klebsiella phage CX1 TaxID=2713210 RepID=A0A6G8R467_9CAUD|nr:hypothetical protein CX1_13 [Klebsiella phage CX1]
MSKFKVGDKVQRINKIEGKTMRGEVVTKGPGLYIDIKLTEGAGIHYAGDIYGGSADFWQLIEEADELPPVPDSVMYYNSTAGEDNFQHMLVQPHWELEGHLSISIVKSGIKFDPLAYGDVLSLNLEPDAALQLAHDLRRMAMGIKRKEKAQ